MTRDVTDASPGQVLNVFEAVDVITIIKGGVYDDLTLGVGEALTKRSDVRIVPDPQPRPTSRADAEQEFPGIYTCTLDDRLDTIFDTIRRSRVHRLVVIDQSNQLKGVLTLSDILEYILLEGESDEG